MIIGIILVTLIIIFLYVNKKYINKKKYSNKEYSSKEYPSKEYSNKEKEYKDLLESKQLDAYQTGQYKIKYIKGFIKIKFNESILKEISLYVHEGNSTEYNNNYFIDLYFNGSYYFVEDSYVYGNYAKNKLRVYIYRDLHNNYNVEKERLLELEKMEKLNFNIKMNKEYIEKIHELNSLDKAYVAKYNINKKVEEEFKPLFDKANRLKEILEETSKLHKEAKQIQRDYRKEKDLEIIRGKNKGEILFNNTVKNLNILCKNKKEIKF